MNGPNLNLLGVREPHIYGSTTLEAIEASCRELRGSSARQLDFRQSNHEGAWSTPSRPRAARRRRLIINPAASSFTSVALSTR